MSAAAPEWDLVSRFYELEATQDQLVGEIDEASRRLYKGELTAEQYRPLWIELSQRLADVTREQRRHSRMPWVALRDAQYTLSSESDASAELPWPARSVLAAGLAEMSLAHAGSDDRQAVARSVKDWIEARGLAAEDGPAGDKYRKLVAATDALLK